MEDLFTKSLPIERLRPIIEQSVQSHRVVIIQTGTGSGKSTQVPQYLLAFANKVVVTQPRRIAAASIAQRVAKEMDVKLGTIVGYKTGAGSRFSTETRLLYCTDGLEVMRQLFGQETLEDTIVVIDEAHEWSINLELLIAWFRLRMNREKNIRLVILSATLDAELLSTYFDDVDVISATEHTFSITDISPKGSVVESAKMLLRQECNVLVFMPGKVEILRAVNQLRRENPNNVILPLYSGLSEKEQEACFAQYDVPKCIVATNVAQTSITIPDIDAVVDSGMERRAEVIDGVEGLYLRSISLADREQRRGRAGRVRSGIYIDCCPVPIAERKMFSPAAILVEGLEGMVLQLMCAGIAPEELTFFHQPKQERLESAKTTLRNLRCLTDENQVTDIGKFVASIPMSTRYARMVAETYRKQKDECFVDRDTLMLAIILQEGGVLSHKNDAWKEYVSRSMLENTSDAYAELAAFQAARSISRTVRERIGIDDLACDRVLNTYQQICGKLRKRGIATRQAGFGVLQQAIVSGLCDHAYQRSVVGDTYMRIGSKSMPRKLSSSSVVKDANLIVGIPWSFQATTEFGPRTIRVIRTATKIAPELLKRFSP